MERVDKTLGSESYDYGYALTKVNYITGYTEGDLNGQNNAGSSDVFISI